MTQYVRPIITPENDIAARLFEGQELPNSITLLNEDEIGSLFSLIRIMCNIQQPSGTEYEILSMFGHVNLSDEIQPKTDMLINRICANIGSGPDEDGVELFVSSPRLQGFLEYGERISEYEGFITPILNGKSWLVSADYGQMIYETYYDEISKFINRFHKVIGGLVATLFTELTKNSFSVDVTTVRFESAVPTKVLNHESGQLPEGFDAFMNFAGIDHVITELRNFAKLANMTPEQLKRAGVEMPHSVLLYGPSGVGKTDLMHALARQINADVIEMSYAELVNSLVGQWAKNIDDVFENAYASGRRVMIIVDEFDGLTQNGNPQSSNNINAVIKNQLENIKNYPNVFFAAATNSVDSIASEIKSDKRLPVKIQITLPGQTQRAEIIKQLLLDDRLGELSIDDVESMIRLNQQSQDLDFGLLAAETDGFSAGDIKEVIAAVNRQRLLAYVGDDVEIVAESLPSQQQIIEAIKYARRTKF